MEQTTENVESSDLASIEEIAEQGTKQVSQEQPSEQAAATDDKYAGKSREDLAKMLDESQSFIGKQSNEIAQNRERINALEKTDSYIKGQLNQSQPEPAKELDYFGDPENAIKQTVSSDPRLAKLEKQLEVQDLERKREKMLSKHPDFQSVMDSPDFSAWLAQTQSRQAALTLMNSTGNVDLAIGLLDEFKSTREQATKETRQESIKAASSGSVSGSSMKAMGKRVAASELRRLQKEEPAKFKSLKPLIDQLWQEGRVVVDA